MMWRKLASFLNIGPTFKVLYNKKDFSGATEDYLNDFMVCKSEHKDVDIKKSRCRADEVTLGITTSNTASALFFFQFFAAAGTDLEFANPNPNPNKG